MQDVSGITYGGIIQIVQVKERVDVDLSLYRCVPINVNMTSRNNPSGDNRHISIPSPDNDATYTIFCRSLNNAPLVINRLYLAYQIRRGGYIIDNQAIWLELQNPGI